MDELTSSPRLFFFLSIHNPIPGCVPFPPDYFFLSSPCKKEKWDVSAGREARRVKHANQWFLGRLVSTNLHNKKKPTEKTGGERNTQGGAREKRERGERDEGRETWACPRKACIRFVVFLSSLHALFYLGEREQRTEEGTWTFLHRDREKRQNSPFSTPIRPFCLFLSVCDSFAERVR